ncbi:MAG: hypothetical protein ACXWC6_08570 [Ramlibacter sp.]
MRRADLAIAPALLLAGCAGLQSLSQPERPMFRDMALPPQAAAEAIAVGRSTQPEVAARLGEADRLRFDNGYEVWVYRAHPVRADQPELVLLFAPDGVLKKLRVRPAAARAG